MSRYIDPASQETAIIGLVSISDRASQGTYQDKGIPALSEWLSATLTTPFQLETRLIPDDRTIIESTLCELVDEKRCCLILTTGGTGPARRDVTPEATLAVATREIPGFAERMRQIGMYFVPTAILSRQVAVIRETADHATLILNLPGRPRAINETLDGVVAPDGTIIEPGVFTAIPYCIDLIGGPWIETDEKRCKAWRPARKTL